MRMNWALRPPRYGRKALLPVRRGKRQVLGLVAGIRPPRPHGARVRRPRARLPAGSSTRGHSREAYRFASGLGISEPPTRG